MPRPLKPGFDAPFTDTITAPLYLFELSLKQRTYRFCSFDEPIRVLDQYWYDQNIQVQGPTQKSGGTLQASVTAPYDARVIEGVTLMDDILAERPQDRPTRLGFTYLHHDAYLEPVLLLEGVIDNVTLGAAGDNKQRLTFSIVSKGNRGGVTPFIRIAKPLLNRITPAGSVVAFNGARYEIDR